MTAAGDEATIWQPDRLDAYLPRYVQLLEERVAHAEDEMKVAVRVAPCLWRHLPDPDRLILVVQDIARRYHSYLERTPDTKQRDVATVIERYLRQVEKELGPLCANPTAMWAEYAARLEPEVIVAEPQPAKVTRRLRCYDPCCRNDPHAEMRLLVDGREIGGTWFDPQLQWQSWGPAGYSSGHERRADAEAVQAEAVQAEAVRRGEN